MLIRVKTRDRGRACNIDWSARFAAGAWSQYRVWWDRRMSTILAPVGGGVWRRKKGGLPWKRIFDKQKDASPAIGAIAVSESDPNVIYVGTGEACIRGNIVGGNGIYKSID